MTTYWISFRLDDDASHRPAYETRYKCLTDTLLSLAGSKYWAGTTSFMVFESGLSIEAIATKLKGCILPRLDLFLIRALDTKDAIFCGVLKDQDLLELIPYVEQI